MPADEALLDSSEVQRVGERAVEFVADQFFATDGALGRVKKGEQSRLIDLFAWLFRLPIRRLAFLPHARIQLQRFRVGPWSVPLHRFDGCLGEAENDPAGGVAAATIVVVFMFAVVADSFVNACAFADLAGALNLHHTERAEPFI